MKSILILVIVWNLVLFLNCEENWNHTEIKYPDVEAEQQQARLYGVAVSVAMCMIFVVMFCISFPYYKLKACHQRKLEARRVTVKEIPHVTIKEEPHVIIKESTSTCRNKQASLNDQQSEENVELVTQVTKF